MVSRYTYYKSKNVWNTELITNIYYKLLYYHKNEVTYCSSQGSKKKLTLKKAI